MGMVAFARSFSFVCLSSGVSRKKASQEHSVQGDGDIPGAGNVKIYSYNELRKATGGFSNKIGEGGFGSVYKGRLKDGKVVAVKVLSTESRQGIREFLNELTVISDIVHENLVQLYGCCVEGTHRIIVYNYLENNSIAQTLLGSDRSNIQFNWKTRVKICVGVARGLAFLHEEVNPHIVHRDIKASNILLDKDLNPKISDFGLAKLLPPNTTHVSTRVAGTIGYLAPEYAIRGQVTRKSDVYSFGVLLLEIVSGRCNTDPGLPYDDQVLLERDHHPDFLVQTWLLYNRGELPKIIDSSLDHDLDIEEACRFIKIGLLCTQEATRLRPPMSTVIQMLTGKKNINSEEIDRPAVINDFMALKIRSQRRDEDIQTSMSSTFLGTSTILSDNILHASIIE